MWVDGMWWLVVACDGELKEEPPMFVIYLPLTNVVRAYPLPSIPQVRLMSSECVWIVPGTHEA